MIEAGVLVDLTDDPEGVPIYWHLPQNRDTVALPESRPLWDIIWEHRDKALGFAHTHPGSGRPGPSQEDVTSFAAIEAGLGKRLIWWIVSSDSFVDLGWVGPHALSYKAGPCLFQPSWVERLRKESQY